MANSDQILSLIRCHLEGDDDRFRSIALQISASEAKAGHTVLARAIKDLLKANKMHVLKPKLSMLNSDIADLLLEEDCPYRLSDLVVNPSLETQIKRVIKEYFQREKLMKYNLANRRKILMAGPSGTGKTMTASVIANELQLPLLVVRLEKIVTKFMGETSLKLSKVFDAIRQIQGVYLFDEFDAIGQRRGLDNEVGEMRRVLNSFLQMLERDQSDSLILAATNDMDSLDTALFRRFDDIWEYALPTNDEKSEIIKRKLAGFSLEGDIHTILPLMTNMSQAEICRVCTDTIKESLLYDRHISVELFNEVISQRINPFKIV